MFSGVIKLGDLNDWNTSAQDCVVELAKKADSASREDYAGNQRQVVSSLVKPSLIRNSAKRKKAKGSSGVALKEEDRKDVSDHQKDLDHSSSVAQVSLYDCLACSGCVTSSDAELVQHQSLDILFSRMRQAKFSVISFSLETLRFLTQHFRSTDTRECFRKLSYFLKRHLCISAVVDVSLVQSLCLVEVAEQFIEKYQRDLSRQNEMSLDRTNVRRYGKDKLKDPLLTSSCPGWVYFCEKTQPSSIVEQMTKTKSTQQMTGFFVKTLMVDAFNLIMIRDKYQENLSYLSKHLDGSVLRIIKKYSTRPDTSKLLSYSEILHITVVPCYDKKLEISREESRLPETVTSESIPEIDIALATNEVIELLHRYGIETSEDFHTILKEEPEELVDDLLLRTGIWYPWIMSLKKVPRHFLKRKGLVDLALDENKMTMLIRQVSTHSTPHCVCCHTLLPTRFQHDSGGFLEYVFRYAAQELFNIYLKETDILDYKDLSNKDFKEVTLSLRGQTVLRFIYAYGLRNLQNLIQTLKKKGDQPMFDFAEVMACPRGCNYGAGQVSSHGTRKEKNEAPPLPLESVPQHAYILPPHQNPFVYLLYQYALSRTLDAYETRENDSQQLEILKAHFRSSAEKTSSNANLSSQTW